MRTIKETTRLYNMLISDDEEMRDLAVSIVAPKLFNSGYYHPTSRPFYAHQIANGLVYDSDRDKVKHKYLK